METAYTSDSLRALFQSAFDLKRWYDLLENLLGATELKTTPERTEQISSDKGYYLGTVDTSDDYRIGLFHFKIAEGSVVNKRVGLRHLVKSFINPTWGEFDAALVVFDSGDHWRLSFVCDIKGEVTSPKRYTYVFGQKGNYYHTAVSSFIELQRQGVTFSTIKEAFSVEPLTKQFYKDLFGWYLWAIDSASNITFPNNTAIEEDDREDLETKIIRMITRLMFVWFIKQKNLIPAQLFELDFLQTILKEFDPYSPTKGNYYNAVLQNLFFGTLNRAIQDDNGNTRKFASSSKRDVKNLYRYAEMFAISEQEVIHLFSEVPFLNGGLFECLDKTRHSDGVEQCYNDDGFSRNALRFADGRYKHRAVVPNILFFEPEKGLLSILSRYNFTIEENSPEEQEVALDPELLGKVFENLLGAYNPETKETARNQSGSFYTPREVVNYMVEESLVAYLGNIPEARQLFRSDFEYDPQQRDFYQQVVERLKQVKILDPACGSGAFPMGLLSRMVDILQRISPSENAYDLKLCLIENCLYGSDIQSIAAQITKLRFFISLICECEKDASKPNFGIPTLPNLETKFVSSDSLLAKKKKPIQGNLFENPEINQIKEDLIKVRHQHFSARSASTKHRLREKDQELREKLAKLLSEDDLFTPEDALQLAAWNPYDQNAVSSFFDPEWMFGVADGFDIVIGNPPYIQLQNNGGELANRYKDCKYESFARTGDVYCLFYERGWQLLKKGGHLCYITSNKWMRAGYGEKTRQFFASKTNPKLLVDFAGVKVFESATVDTNILLFAKEANEAQTQAVSLSKNVQIGGSKLCKYIQQHATASAFISSESWVILSPIEQSIKRKIEAVGKPLKDWDIQINYGIKTGCNEAFIIDEDKRNEILNNCRNEDERKRTEEIIRPILRGRDIKRYGYEWAEWWLIATLPSRHYDIEQYPAVKDYLLAFGKERLEQTGQIYIINGEKVKSRKKTNNKWFETQDSISYWEDFDKPKVMWKIIGCNINFCFDERQLICNNAVNIMTGKRDELIQFVGLMNSKLFDWYLKLTTEAEVQGGGVQLYVTTLEKTLLKLDFQKTFTDVVYRRIENKVNDNVVDKAIFDAYKLTSEEQEFIIEEER